MSVARNLHLRVRSLRRRYWTAGLVVGLASVVLVYTGQGAAQTKATTLTVGFTGQMPGLDVTTANNAGFQISDLSLETLFYVRPDGRIAPWLATGVKHPNSTTYIYSLRRGVKFWDGVPFTSKDVVASWQYEARKKSVRASYFASVARIKATGKYTVLVKLKHPDASWQFIPAMFFSQIFEKKFFDAHKGTFGLPGTLVMGTGPWKIDSLDPTSGAEFSANPEYWGGKVPFSRISVKFYKDETSLALAMRAGEIDLDPVVAAPKSFAASSGGVKITTVPTCGTALISMPTQAPPWNDVHVRRAVAYAINKKAIIAATQGSTHTTLDTMIAPSLLSSLGTKKQVAAALDSVPTYPFNLAKAKAEMAKSASPNGFTAPLATFDTDNFLAVDQVIAAQLKKIGIKVKIDNVGQTAWYAAVFGPPAKRPFTFSTTGACTPDPSWDDLWYGKGAPVNAANYAPPAVNKLIDRGLRTSAPHERLKIYTSLLKHLAADVPYVPVYLEGASYASNKYTFKRFGSFWASFPWALNLRPT